MVATGLGVLPALRSPPAIPTRLEPISSLWMARRSTKSGERRHGVKASWFSNFQYYPGRFSPSTLGAASSEPSIEFAESVVGDKGKRERQQCRLAQPLVVTTPAPPSRLRLRRGRGQVWSFPAEKKDLRLPQDSNLRTNFVMDFKSIALTTRPDSQKDDRCS